MVTNAIKGTKVGVVAIKWAWPKNFARISGTIDYRATYVYGIGNG